MNTGSSECVPVWRCPPFGVSLSVGPAVALQTTSHCYNLRAQHSSWQPPEAQYCETREEGIEARGSGGSYEQVSEGDGSQCREGAEPPPGQTLLLSWRQLLS